MPATTPLTTDDLDYELPAQLVAQHPAAQRGGSRLMVLQAGEAEPRCIGRFDELLPEQLREGDLVVANDSRVLHARLRVQRPTGGTGELLLLSPLAGPQPEQGSLWTAMARPARRYRAGQELRTIDGAASVRCLERTGAQTWTIELPVSADAVPGWLARHGELPLPPYITERGQDPARYQTVHARTDGSVAAPTAGLHFDEQTWERVGARAEVAHVTLHVGAGTFLPVAERELAAHVMHRERYEVPEPTHAAITRALEEGRRVVAIGTTATRTLEHVYADDGTDPASRLAGSTELFIVPGHRWSCVGALLTNFHLPRSTLLALVMAFHGVEPTRHAYRRAVEEQLRFYSFGDAMLIHGPAARR